MNTAKNKKEIIVFVVGTGEDLGLSRIVDYLYKKYGLPINVVLFQTFGLENGQHLLVRELTDSILKYPHQEVIVTVHPSRLRNYSNKQKNMELVKTFRKSWV